MNKSYLLIAFNIFSAVFGISLLLFLVTYESPVVSLIDQNPPQKSVLSEQKTNLQEEITIPPLTLETIFKNDHSWTESLPSDKKVSLIATGDVLPARTVNHKTVTKVNFLWPFENIAELLRSSDITLINLETPILSDCPKTQEGMIFCGDARNIEGLTFAGIDVANIANNHIGNWGQAGVDETVDLLSQSNVKISGLQNPSFIDVNGTRLAFLGYNDIGRQPGVSHVDDGTLEQDIKHAKGNADVVVVSFHFGEEYTYEPTARQKEIAHRAVDAGTDLVIGNHPHWIQPAELYNGKLIVYAHGNTVFDQMWSEETKTGVIGTYTFYENKLIDAEFTPLYIVDFGQPRILEGEERLRILEKLYEISESN